MILRICILSIVLVFASLAVNAQYHKKDKPQTGFGAGLIYNLPVNSLGVELRAKIPLWNSLFIVPEISYFLPFNPIHELYAGAALHYESPVNLGRFTPYAAAGLFYNNWMNVADYRNSTKDRHNLAPELGIGLVRSEGCIRPYIEGRVDTRWKESTIRIGILIYRGDCLLRMRKVKCPAYG